MVAEHNQVAAGVRCTCALARMASRRVSRIYDRHLAPSGLGIAQYGLLHVVARNDGASVTALASLLEMERTTLTRNLQPLERDGLLHIVAGSDQRTKAVRITDAGRSAYDTARPLWQSAQDAMAQAMGPQQLEAFHAALNAMLCAVPGT